MTRQFEQADVGVLAVIPEELRWAQQAFNIRSESSWKNATGTIYWHSSVKSTLAKRPYRITLTCVGRPGNTQSAAATSEMIFAYRPRFLLLIGIAAGIRDVVKIGEIILSEQVFAYEPGTLREDGTFGPRPNVSRVQHTVTQDVARYLASSWQRRLEQRFKRVGTYPTSANANEDDEFRHHLTHIASLRSAVVASGEKLLRDPRKAHFVPAISPWRTAIEIVLPEG